MSVVGSSFLSRTAAIALLGVALVGTWSLLIAPLVTMFEDTIEQINRHRDLIIQYTRIAAKRPSLEAARESLRSSSTLSELTMAGASAAIVGADLQASIKRTAGQAGGELRTLLTLPPVDEGGYQRIALRIEIAGTVESLQRILVAVETQSPVLFVDGMTIHARDAGAGDAAQRSLNMRLDLYGYRRGGA